MVPLVQRVEAQEIRRGAKRSRGALALPRNGAHVVAARSDGAFADIEAMGSYVTLHDGARQLQVGVGDGSQGVGIGNQTAGNVGRKFCTPHNG